MSVSLDKVYIMTCLQGWLAAVVDKYYYYSAVVVDWYLISGTRYPASKLRIATCNDLPSSLTLLHILLCTLLQPLTVVAALVKVNVCTQLSACPTGVLHLNGKICPNP